MSERPDFVLACNELTIVMYPANKAVGLQVVDPAGQKLFISLPGRRLVELGKQLQEFPDQHPEVLDWETVNIGEQAGPEG